MLNVHPVEGLRNPTSFRPIGTLLVESGKINGDDMRRVLDYQKKHSLMFGEAAVRMKIAERRDVERALAAQFDYPYIDTDKIELTNDLVIAHQPFGASADAIRKIRTQIALQWNHFSSEGLTSNPLAVANKGEKTDTTKTHITPRHPTFAIVGAGKGDGSTYVAANLAVSMAQLGKKTLLIDGDLRNGRIHKMFGLSDQFGLSNILGGRTDRNYAIDIDQIPLLSIIPSGTIPPNPTELISRDRMRLLIDVLRENYDVIIIDTPSSDTNSDAEIYGLLAGNAIIVARKDKSGIDALRNTVDALCKLNVTITGSILNEGV